MFQRLFKTCVVFVFSLTVGGCSPSMFGETSPNSNINVSDIEIGKKALVLFRANTPKGSTVETRWLNLSTGKETRISTQFFTLTEEATREYDMVTLTPGEYVLTYAVYGSFKPWVSPEMNPEAGPYSELGQVVVDGETQDGHRSYLYALTCHGTDGKGQPLIASFSVKGGEVVYIGDMTIDYTYLNPNKLKVTGHFSANNVMLGLSNQRTRAKNSLLEINPLLAEKMQYRPFSFGKLAKKI